MLTSTVPTTSMNDFTTFNSSMTSSEHEDDFDDHPREPSNNTIMDSFESCSTLMRTERKIFIVFLLFSVILTTGLAFTVRRKNYRLSCCWGRPGVLQPVNFIDEVHRRWAYAACFVILTNDMLGHFVHQGYLNLLLTDDEKWMRKVVWIRVFVKLLEALAVSLVYYPLLACINHRRSLVANVLGMLYLIPWILIYSSILYFCPIHGDGSFLKALNWIARIPICLAFYIVGFSYILDFKINIGRRGTRDRGTISTTICSKSVGAHLGNSIWFHLKYVANLLRRRKEEQATIQVNSIRRKSEGLIKRVKYDSIMVGFRYSTRLVCCTTTAVTLVIWIVLVNVAWTVDDFERYSKLCEELDDVSLLSFLEPICKHISVTQILFHVANAGAGLIVLIIIINTLVTYKRRWHQLLRGDHSWHMYGATIDSPPGTLLSGLKYAGYQVAYAAWGWLVLSIALQIVLLLLVFAFIVPLITGEHYWLITWLGEVWPTVPLGIAIALILKLICRLIFLQDEGSVMALDNRRLYNATSYYFLVLNVIVGIFSCLKRILVPLALGILFLSRLDQPFIIKGFETKDPAYVSFVSMLLVDLYHNHPVVKVFVELMLQVRKREKLLTGVNGRSVVESEDKLRRSRLIRNRWWKTVTLANNPSLVEEILEQRLKDERKVARQTIRSPIDVRSDNLSSIEIQPLPENAANGLPNSKSSSEKATQVSEK